MITVNVSSYEEKADNGKITVMFQAVIKWLVSGCYVQYIASGKNEQAAIKAAMYSMPIDSVNWEDITTLYGKVYKPYILRIVSMAILFQRLKYEQGKAYSPSHCIACIFKQIKKSMSKTTLGFFDTLALLETRQAEKTHIQPLSPIQYDVMRIDLHNACTHNFKCLTLAKKWLGYEVSFNAVFNELVYTMNKSAIVAYNAMTSIEDITTLDRLTDKIAAKKRLDMWYDKLTDTQKNTILAYKQAVLCETEIDKRGKLYKAMQYVCKPLGTSPNVFIEGYLRITA